MSDKINIREYTSTDKNQVMEIVRLNIPKYFAPEEEQDFSNYLDNEIEQYFVLLVANRIVGCGGINLTENKTIGKLSWGMIHPDYQRKALGTKLLQYRIEKLKSIKTVQKITVRTSQMVFPFFKKQNFKLNKIEKDYWAKGLHLYDMELKMEEIE